MNGVLPDTALRRMIAEGGRDAYYDGPIAETIERYFRRIGGWMTRADLAEREGSFEEAGRLRYGEMPALETQIRDMEAAQAAAKVKVGA